MLKPCDIQKHLGCGKDKVYKIIKQPDFPKIKIGKQFYIPEEEYLNWIKRYTTKEYKLCCDII